LKFCLDIESINDTYKLTINEVKYLKLIFRHYEENKPLSLTSLSKLLGIRPSSAIDTINNLVKKGLLVKKRGALELTEEGIKLAKFIAMKRRVLELYFFYVLNLSIKESKKEAEKVDFLLSCNVIEKMMEKLKKMHKNITLCPHGKNTYCSDFFKIER